MRKGFINFVSYLVPFHIRVKDSTHPQLAIDPLASHRSHLRRHWYIKTRNPHHVHRRRRHHGPFRLLIHTPSSRREAIFRRPGRGVLLLSVDVESPDPRSVSPPIILPLRRRCQRHGDHQECDHHHCRDPLSLNASGATTN